MAVLKWIQVDSVHNVETVTMKLTIFVTHVILVAQLAVIQQTV